VAKTIEEMAAEAEKCHLIAMNARVPSKAEIIEIYHQAYEGFE
jgi:hypothetical protein